MKEQDNNICPKCGKKNTYWNGGSHISTVTKLQLLTIECHDCGIEYEATTADEYNEEYLQEAADDMQKQTDIHYARKEIKGSRDGYWDWKEKYNHE